MQDNFINQIPPHNLEAEQSVLGAVLLDPGMFLEILNLLRPSDFYEPKHSLIYKAMIKLHEDGVKIDLVTLSDLLDRDNMTEKVGGVSYMANLVNATPIASHGLHYARIVQRKSLSRRLIAKAANIQAAAYAEKEMDELLEFAKAEIEEIVEIKAEQEPDSEVLQLADAVDKILEIKGVKDHFPIGFKTFEEVMEGGVGDGDLVVISGRSGHGKTTLAQTMSYHLAQIGLPQLWFSYEVELEELWQKFKEMGAQRDYIAYVPLKLKSGRVDWIEEQINKAVEKFNTKIVFVDHLGFLLPRVSEKDAFRFEANASMYLANIVRQLKMLAIQKRIIIVLMAHTRKTKDDLTMEDIAHSAGVAQEADFVFMLERLPEGKAKRSLADAETEGEILSEFTKVSLVKNRRTGRQKFMKMQIKNGRLSEVTAHNVLGDKLKEVGIEID